MTTPRVEAAPGESELPSWLRPWVRFWFAPIDPTGLGFIRICCGLLLLYNHLLYCYDFNSYLGRHSWLDASVQQYIRKEAPVPRPPGDWTDWSNPTQNPQNQIFPEKGSFYWSIFYHVQDPAWAVVIHVAVFGVLILFTLGLWTRVTSVLAWACMIQYIHRLTFQLFGMDTMLMILVLYLMIDGGAALSLDRWLERRRALARGEDAALKPSCTSNLAIRLIQVHYCFIYLTSGASKLLGPSWWNGTALWSCLDNYNFAPMRVGLYNWLLLVLCQNYWLWEIVLTASTVFTLFTETCFTFLVWNRKLRPFMVACSVFLHLGIGLLMGLVTFQPVHARAMVLAFVPPDQMRHYVDGIRGWLAGLWSRKEPPPVPAGEPESRPRTDVAVPVGGGR